MHVRVPNKLARYVRTCMTIRVRENIRQSRSSKWYTRTTPYIACKLPTPPPFLEQNSVYFKFFPVMCMTYPIAKICLQSKNQNSVTSKTFSLPIIIICLLLVLTWRKEAPHGSMYLLLRCLNGGHKIIMKAVIYLICDETTLSIWMIKFTTFVFTVII